MSKKRLVVVIGSVLFAFASLLAYTYYAPLHDPIMGIRISVKERNGWCEQIGQNSPCCPGYRSGLKERAASQGFVYAPKGDNAAWCDVIAHDSPECPKHMTVVELLDNRCYNDMRWCNNHGHADDDCPFHGKP